jgi:thiol-disulfide isomerase/thioredoxin
MSRKAVRIALSLVATVALGLSLFFAFDRISARPGMAQESEEGEADETILLPEWASIELVDAVTGEPFTIADFAGRPILVESFAVWCPICLRQQKEMARLLELEGDSIVHVSLDTDPNEDAVAVRRHAEEHGFTWRFAVAPFEMTQRLIDEFGLIVANPPSAPVLLIDVDGSARLLPRGVKSAEELLEEIAGTG